MTMLQTTASIDLLKLDYPAYFKLKVGLYCQRIYNEV